MGNIDLETLSKNIPGNLADLQNLQFSPTNPLFWLFYLIVLLLLTRLWELKKSFSFCTFISALLLIMTWLEETSLKNLDKTDIPYFLALRMAPAIIILVILLYYQFLKD